MFGITWISYILKKKIFTPVITTCNQLLFPHPPNGAIDYGSIDHMIGNSSLFSIFQSNTTTSNVTLADRSPSCVLVSGTVTLTPLLPLTLVLHLPHLSLF